jgi:adenylate cyclase
LLGTRVLLSATSRAGKSTSASDVGTFLLRGKRLPVGVFEPIAIAGCRLDGRSIEEFAAALAAFRRGDWQAAQQAFAALAARFPADGPSRYYEALSDAMRRDPPASWTGVVRVTAK